MNFKNTIITLILSTFVLNFSFAQEKISEKEITNFLIPASRMDTYSLSTNTNSTSSKNFIKGRREIQKIELQDEVSLKLKEIEGRYKTWSATNTATYTKNQVKGMAREIKYEIENFRQEKRKVLDPLIQEKVLNNPIAIEKIANKLNLNSEELVIQISATNTDLKTLLKNASLTKEEVRQILPPIVKERIATTSQNFIPRTLQNIFGARKEKVTETVNEAGEVEVKVESNAGFFRKFFGF